MRSCVCMCCMNLLLGHRDLVIMTTPMAECWLLH